MQKFDDEFVYDLFQLAKDEDWESDDDDEDDDEDVDEEEDEDY